MAPLIYNGTTITAVVYNGTNLSSLVYNGTAVWSAGPTLSYFWRYNSITVGSYLRGINSSFQVESQTSSLTNTPHRNSNFGGGSFDSVSVIMEGGLYSSNGASNIYSGIDAYNRSMTCISGRFYNTGISTSVSSGGAIAGSSALAYQAGNTNLVVRANSSGAFLGASNAGTARVGYSSGAGANMGSIGMFFGGGTSSYGSMPLDVITRIDSNGALYGSETAIGTGNRASNGASLKNTTAIYTHGLNASSVPINVTYKVNSNGSVIQTTGAIVNNYYGSSVGTLSSYVVFDTLVLYNNAAFINSMLYGIDENLNISTLNSSLSPQLAYGQGATPSIHFN